MRSKLLLHAFVYLLMSCQDIRENEAPDEIQVSYQVVQEKEISNMIRAAGRLSSSLESKLSFKTGGIIADIHVQEGDQVRNGQLLASLDLSEIRNRERQASLAFRKAKRDFQRAQNLYRDSVITLEQFQNVRTALEMAEAEQAIAGFNLEHSQIKAPSQGKILRKMAENNEIVGPGQPVFLFASTLTDWVFRVSITDRDRVKLDVGDSARIRFDAYPGHLYSSRISELGEMADPYTGTFEVELTIEPRQEKLFNGMIGTAWLYPADRHRMPVIPHEALVEADAGEGVVYLIRGNRAVRKQIRIQRILDSGLVIEEGLVPGDTLITEGASYIRDRIRIRYAGNDEN